MLTAMVATAEAAVSNNALRCIFAVFVGAAYLLGWHAAAQREGHV